jgi:hypothetical protein
MWFVGEAFSSIAASLAEVNRDSESGSARGNVHGGSTSKVETSEFVRPSVRVPGPVGNRVVDERRPNEDKDNRRTELAALGDRTDCKHGRNRREHELIDAEHNRGNARRAHRRSVEHIDQGRMLEITDKGPSCLRESERKSENVPLRNASKLARTREPCLRAYLEGHDTDCNHA